MIRQSGNLEWAAITVDEPVAGNLDASEIWRDATEKHIAEQGFATNVEKHIDGLVATFQFSKAKTLLSDYLKYNEETFGIVSKPVEQTLGSLGAACELDGNCLEAERYYLSQLAVAEGLHGRDSIKTGVASENIARTFVGQGFDKLAVSYYEDALGAFRKNEPWLNPHAGSRLVSTISSYVPVLRRLEQKEKANLLVSEAQSVIFAHRKYKNIQPSRPLAAA